RHVAMGRAGRARDKALLVRYDAAYITTTSRGVEGLARRNPGNPPERGRCQLQQVESLGDVSGSPDRTSAHQPGRGFFSGRKRNGKEARLESDGAGGTGVQGVRGALPAGGPVRVRAVLRAARGLLRLLRPRPRGGPAADP